MSYLVLFLALEVNMIAKLKNEQELLDLIKKDKVLLDFNAVWCGPCKMMEPHLEKLDANYPDLKIISIDVDNFNEIAAKYNITSIPTFIYYQDGHIKFSHIGYLPYQQLERIIK